MGTLSLDLFIIGRKGRLYICSTSLKFHIFIIFYTTFVLFPMLSSLVQLKHVVNQLHQMSKSNRLPLVVLHRSRVFGGPAQYPNNKKLIESWRNAGALYATPPGSNDDW